MDHEKLNDDQKRSLKTLSSLEAAYKELEDVKKSIEVCTITSDAHHARNTLSGTRKRVTSRSSIKACRNRTYTVSQSPRGYFFCAGKASIYIYMNSILYHLTSSYRRPTYQGRPRC